MDGRVQLPVIPFLQTRFKAEFVDCITEPGPVRIFAKTTDLMVLNSIITRVDISVKQHDSGGIAICAHPDCAGNPIDDDIQKEQLKRSVIFLKEAYPNVDVIGLWIDNNQQPQEYC
jgi:carbonic anhydrase